MSRSYSGKYQDDEMNNYLSMLQDGCFNVLLNIYDCDEFSVELLHKIRGNHLQTCVVVIIFLLRSPTTSNDRYLSAVDPKRNILHHLLFVCIPNGNMI